VKGVPIAMPGKLSDEEKDWRAEDDLRTLIEAEKIKQDPKRLKPAMAKKKALSQALKGLD